MGVDRAAAHVVVERGRHGGGRQDVETMPDVATFQAADWPRLAEAPAADDLALRGASGEPAGRSMCHPVFDIAGHVKAPCPPWPSSDA